MCTVTHNRIGHHLRLLSLLPLAVLFLDEFILPRQRLQFPGAVLWRLLLLAGGSLDHHLNHEVAIARLSNFPRNKKGHANGASRQAPYAQWTRIAHERIWGGIARFPIPTKAKGGRKDCSLVSTHLGHDVIIHGRDRLRKRLRRVGRLESECSAHDEQGNGHTLLRAAQYEGDVGSKIPSKPINEKHRGAGGRSRAADVT